jgi:hypothetical protein
MFTTNMQQFVKTENVKGHLKITLASWGFLVHD